jgi:hypothetical protein
MDCPKCNNPLPEDVETCERCALVSQPAPMPSASIQGRVEVEHQTGGLAAGVNSPQHQYVGPTTIHYGWTSRSSFRLLPEFVRTHLQLGLMVSVGVLQSGIVLLAYSDKLPSIFWENPLHILFLGWVFAMITMMLPLRHRGSAVSAEANSSEKRTIPSKAKIAFALILTVITASGVSIVCLRRKQDSIYNAPDTHLFAMVILSPVSLKQETELLNVQPTLLTQPRKPIKRKSKDGATEEIKKAPRPTIKGVNVRWAFVENLSSMLSKKDHDLLSIYPNNRVVQRMLFAHDKLNLDEKNQRVRITEWLKNRSEVIGHPSFVDLIGNSDESLMRLAHYSDVIRQLLPSPGEVASLKEADQQLIRDWLINYVGQWCPRLRFTVDNDTDQNLQITSLFYDVKYNAEWRFAMGALPRTPPIPYYFPVLYKKGVQRYDLASSEVKGEVSVETKKVTSFDVVFFPNHGCPPFPAWYGAILLETNRGQVRVGNLSLKTLSTGGN